MNINVGTIDRVIRVVIGIALLYAGIAGMVAGTLMYLVILIGLVLLVTGVLATCPLYSVLKMSTASKAK